jgi:alginate O-acetyltransferase complex protein AlgI
MSWSVPCVLLILFTSLSDYLIGRRLGQSENPNYRKYLLYLSLAVNLSILGLFKYLNFFLVNLFWGLNVFGINWQPPHYNLILPPGISYYTFVSLGYIIDVYYERATPSHSLKEYFQFIAFFPKMLAGPIVRASDFLPQLQQRIRASWNDIETGLAYILLGAVKKLVICDQISAHVDMIFSAPERFDAFTLLQGLIGYSVQIYCDFSGYSDMAIGFARILGFKLPENFQMPYSATTISEFWRRWHMTLSGWFRDYVFIPLEIATRGNRNVLLRSSLNLIVTMLLVGLWHGASWNFICWGGILGFSLAIHKAWSAWNPLASFKNNRPFQFFWSLISRALTLGVILLGWIFFRAESWTGAKCYLQRLLIWSHEGTRMFSPNILPMVVVVFVVHLLVQKDRIWPQEVPNYRFSVRVLSYSILLIILTCFGATDTAPFIYFRF